MDNWLLLKKSKKLEELSLKLGFKKTLFLDDFILIETEVKKNLLKQVREARKKNLKIIFRPQSEEMLRFTLEKVDVDYILGVENINPKDSVHFVRGALDQIVCKIAKEKGKSFLISFEEILKNKNQSKLISRIAFNSKLCKKYGVNIFFTNLSTSVENIRSQKDLMTLFNTFKINSR